MCRYDRRSAIVRATVPFPAPDGPSIAMMSRRASVTTHYYLAMRWLRVAAIIAAIFAVGATGWWLARPTIESAALLMDMTGAAPGLRPFVPARQYNVTTEDTAVPTRYGPIAARIYRAAGGHGPTLAVFPGVHGGGVDEPRFAALSRRIAAAGATVLATPLPDLRTYRLTANATDMIEDTIVWLGDNRVLAPRGRVGLVSVSFAGGLALVAAGRAQVADRLTAVFALGAHADLPRVVRYLCAGAAGQQNLPPPHDYGVVLMLRASIPLIVPENQRKDLDAALVTFLDASSADASDKALSSRLFADARAAEATLAEPARSYLQAVNNRDVARLGGLLAPFAEQIAGASALSPVRSPATRVPVFLLHGANDNVVPASELGELERYLMSSGNENVEAMLTPMISHADAKQHATTGEAWRLVRFWTRMWNTFKH